MAILCYFAVTGMVGLAAGVYSPRNALFASQLFYPVWAFVLLLVITHDDRLIEAFTGGLQLGLGAAILFIMAALVADWRGFVLAGRIDQYEAPLRGMYQVGNYTPLGLVYAGGLLLALSSMAVSASKSTMGVLALLTGALLFGSRDALLVAALIAAAHVLVKPTRRIVACVALGVVVIGAWMMLGMTSTELQRPTDMKVSSLQRLVAEGVDEKRAELLRDRGIDVLMSGGVGGQMFSGRRGQGELVRESSHNFYMDLLVEWGVLGVVLILVVLCGTVVASVASLAGAVRRNARGWRGARILAAVTVLGIALISSNVRTPYTQPFTAAIAMAAVGLLIGLEARGRRESHLRAGDPSTSGNASLMPPHACGGSALGSLDSEAPP